LALKVNIIILNYNGEELLRRFLPSVVKSAARSRYPCAVTVLDNCSQDESVKFINENFPSVIIYQARENRVLCSYNEIASRVDEDVLIFLNNDIGTEEGFVDPLVSVFEREKDAFFVATHSDCSIAKKRWGIISAETDYPGYAERENRPGLTFSAGVGAFDRKKFLELGGYDDLYLPGRYEDVDLCYRGWKRGWKGYYEPGSRKVHLGAASFEKAFDGMAIQTMVFRNSLLFMVKNVRDPFLLAQFFAMLTARLLTGMVSGRWFLVQGFIRALGRAPQALAKRKIAAQTSCLSDREVLRMVG
jgi:GT2 family glycosyltransferase